MHQFHCRRHAFKDPRTGRTVWQLTGGDFECSAPYMDKTCWTADDRFMLIASNANGTWQPYRLDIESGGVLQIHQTTTPSFNFTLVPQTDEAFIPDGRKLCAVNLKTLQSRVAVDYSLAGEGFTPLPVISSDGQLAMGRCVSSTDAQYCFARTDGTQDFQFCRPASLPCQPLHEQFVPTDSRFFSINAGRGDKTSDWGYDWDSDDPLHRTKTWLIDRQSGQYQPLICLPKGLSATHVVWTRDGERLHFHTKQRPGWVPTGLCSVDRDGGDFRTHYETSRFLLGHSCPHPNRRWIVTDSMEPNENILMAVNLENGEAQILCWPNNSLGSDRPHRRRPDLPPHPHPHTHPGLSSTGRYIHYTSDVSGNCQVYVVPEWMG